MKSMPKFPKGQPLSSTHPKLCKEWEYAKNYPLKPEDVSRGSKIEVWWICSKKHKWQAVVYSRVHGNNCPYCAGRKTNKENCLATTFPELAREWHRTKNGHLTPRDVTKGSTKKIWWKCKKGHEWPATPNVRTFQKTGCPYCNSSRLNPQYNLAVINPKVAKEWHPSKNGKLTPYNVTPLTNTVVWWQCSKGHSWPARVQHRSKGVSNCPYCSKIQLKDGSFFQSITEAFWYLKLRQAGFVFCHNKGYNDKTKDQIGKSRYDFYCPKYNLYIEVTSFNKEWKEWKKYSERIQRKKEYVEKILKERFLFIQYALTTHDLKFVQKYVKDF